MEPKLIDTTATLQGFIDQLGQCDGQPPRLYIDLEGNDLCRNGTLSLVTILLEPEKVVYLIDVTTLGRDAFNTAGSSGQTIEAILESPTIVKVFFDIRNDSDAMFSLFGIRVAGIEDLQLMELASRDFSKRVVNGLAKCIECDAAIGYSEKSQWRSVKDRGKALYDPSRGGSYAVFDQRPLSDEMTQYCVQDVAVMPHLRDVYRRKLCDAWWRKIQTETEARIQLSQSPSYNGKGRHMALGPSAWASWNPSLEERQSRTLFGVPQAREMIQSSSLPASSPSPEISQSAGGEVAPGTIAAALQESIQGPIGKTALRDDSDHEDDYDEDRYRYTGYSHLSYDDDGSDSPRSYIACGRDCDYCGHCQY